MEVENTLAYYNMATTTAVKKFIVQAPVKQPYWNYCIEGTEMRQLGFNVRRLLFLNRY